MKVKELIDEIIKETKENSNTVSSLKEDIDELKKRIKDFEITQNESLKNLRENIDIIKDIKEDLKKELYEFGLLKSQLQNKILQKFEDELKSELKINLEKLKNDYTNYDELKKQISLMLGRTDKLTEELDKFTDISKNIKKEDFELTRFANKLLEMDQEKLSLMRKIDTLERLIAKMRRTV